MENNMMDDLDIPVVDAKSKFDVSIYEGFRTKIAKVTKKQVIDYFPRTAENPEGEYLPNSQIMKWVLEIETVALPELDKEGKATAKLVEFKQEDGSVKNLIVIHRFNLQEITNDAGVKEVVISKHPKAAAWKFFRKLGVMKASELKDKFVTLTTKASKKQDDDRRFLSIVVE